uniref:Uncharacterized protein n=1 Tax=Rhizophora mucronata TaxID=61149 RepID=A0A2P2R1L8_RHIMU
MFQVDLQRWGQASNYQKKKKITVVIIVRLTRRWSA